MKIILATKLSCRGLSRVASRGPVEENADTVCLPAGLGNYSSAKTIS